MAINPTFDRIDKEAQQGAYAGFGQQPAASQQGQWAPPTGAPQAAGSPASRGSADELERMYDQPPAGPAQTGRVSLDDVVMRTLGLFGIFMVAAAAAWYLVGAQPELGTPIWLAGMFGSLGLSFAIAFMKTVNVPLIALHAVLQGGFIGAISVTFNAVYDGVVTTAALATVSTFAGMFVAWKVGIIRVTSKSRRIFGMMAIGYLIFLLANLGLAFFTGGGGVFDGGPLGIAISVFGVAMASYSLAISFDSVDRGIRAGAPQQYSWLMAHGILASLVWLYIEFLRLFAQLQNN